MRCVLKSARISPKKLFMPAKYIRNRTVSDALIECGLRNQKSFGLIGQVIKSARYNLLNQLKKEGKEINDTEYIVDIHTTRGGGSLRRYLPHAKGSAGTMTKERSNIYVTLKPKMSKEINKNG